MTNTLHGRDARTIANIARLRFSPLSLTGGRGIRLIEEGGRALIDLSASAGAASLGYGHPAVVKAVSQAVANEAGASLLLWPNDNAVALAEDLIRITPSRDDGDGRRVWFGHSGSDANDCAVRAIQAATGRSRFVSFIGSYHGNLSGSMAVSGHTAMTHTLPRAGLVLLPYPDPYRPRFSPETVLDLLDYQFETSCPPSQVAAIFLEPILSDGGFIVPPEGFVKALEERCRRHGILLVLDEVKVGLARSGRMHCFEHYGVEPDVVVFGKGLGGGLPLSAVVGPRAIMDHAPAFALQTTAGNPVATAAGRAVIRTIEEEGLVARSAALGARLRAAVDALAATEPMIGEIRGHGLALGLDLVADRATRAPVPVTTTAKIIYRSYELGVALGYVGLKGNVLEIMPPLIATEDDIDLAVAILAEAMADVTAGKVTDEQVAPYMMW